jgi:hypothetical protein
MHLFRGGGRGISVRRECPEAPPLETHLDRMHDRDPRLTACRGHLHPDAERPVFFGVFCER